MGGDNYIFVPPNPISGGPVPLVPPQDFRPRSCGNYSDIIYFTYYSQFTSKHDYDYSLIDGSIIDDKKDTFDAKVTLDYLYSILGVIGFMLIIGVAIDVYNLFHKPTGEAKKRVSEGRV